MSAFMQLHAQLVLACRCSTQPAMTPEAFPPAPRWLTRRSQCSPVNVASQLCHGRSAQIVVPWHVRCGGSAVMRAGSAAACPANRVSCESCSDEQCRDNDLLMLVRPFIL
eukprot:jgi/Ulvmu1/7766/UM039_0075.1